MITQAELHAMFAYDPASGDLIRKTAPHYKTKVGDVSGCVSTDGYRKIKIRSVGYAAHRLVWLYVHGEWPKHEIDHINGQPDDNRIENLRDVPHQVKHGRRSV